MIIGYYAGLLAILYVFLMMRVARMRWVFKVGIGDGGEHKLNKAIRVHGNFTENVPLALLLIFMLETQDTNAILIHVLGGLLFVARILHALGLNKTSKSSFGRGVGAGTTLLVIGSAALILVYSYFRTLY